MTLFVICWTKRDRLVMLCHIIHVYKWCTNTKYD